MHSSPGDLPMNEPQLPTVGFWTAGTSAPTFDGDALAAAIARVREPIHIVRDGERGRVGIAFGGAPAPHTAANGARAWPLLATLPAMYPEWLGDRSFLEEHNLRFPYVAGAMANGICTTDIVIEMARAGMLGFFGAAGLTPDRVEQAIDRIEAALTNGESWGSNLIHAPQEPHIEEGVADLYVRRGVRRVSASAYMALTPYIVHYAFHGVREENGRIIRPNMVFAKISRPEVARRFLSPPPEEILEKLLASGKLTAAEVALARRLPVAEDITVEADSGGHTDNRPLPALFPTIARVRDEVMARYRYTRPIRLGAAGGLGTPDAIAGAFALGAAYVLTGSVNQACVESGLSTEGKQLLAEAGLADVIMAPAADMFELGVKVQVLKRGTMFGPRATKLYEIYNTYDSIESMPAAEREHLEKRILGRPIDEIWQGTKEFFEGRDPREVVKAEKDPKHRMALIFRWYLGLSSRWAITGEPGRKMDFQIWCGPAMGSFNAWTAGSFLEKPEARTVVQVALNLLEGAAVLTRAHQLRTFGAAVPPSAFRFEPRPLSLA
jgi:trans-AT polyketide synthase/acyltransferase/oxidoreductase domain-containing protein